MIFRKAGKDQTEILWAERQFLKNLEILYILFLR